MRIWLIIGIIVLLALIIIPSGMRHPFLNSSRTGTNMLTSSLVMATRK